MARLLITLSDDQRRRLRRAAVRRGVSMASLIRDAVDRRLLEEDVELDEGWRRFFSALGRFHGGGGNVAEDHDRYLDEIYGDH